MANQALAQQQAAATNKLLSFKCLADTVGKFEGTTDVRPFLKKVDTAMTQGGLTNEEAATMASFCFPDGSHAHKWLENRKNQGDLQNLDIWNPVTADPATNPPVAACAGGLRAALDNEFTLFMTEAEAHNALLTVKIQKKGMTFQAYAIALEEACLRHMEIAFKDIKSNYPQAFKDMFKKTLLNLAWEGMLPSYRSPFHQKLEDFTTLTALVKEMVKFEGREGRHLLQGSNQREVPKVTAASGSAPPATLPAETCAYCGIKNHTKPECKSRIHDEAAGEFRDRHKDYPLKTLAERRKLARGNDKDKKRAAGASSGKGGSAPPPPAQNDGQQRAAPAPQPSPFPQVSSAFMPAPYFQGTPPFQQYHPQYHPFPSSDPVGPFQYGGPTIAQQYPSENMTGAPPQ